MESNLPAAPGAPDPDAEERRQLPPSRPLSVAFLPLALVVFTLLAFVIAAWTFLASAT
jgi:hypothetical protein